MVVLQEAEHRAIREALRRLARPRVLVDFPAAIHSVAFPAVTHSEVSPVAIHSVASEAAEAADKSEVKLTLAQEDDNPILFLGFFCPLTIPSPRRLPARSRFGEGRGRRVACLPARVRGDSSPNNLCHRTFNPRNQGFLLEIPKYFF